jgi:hypothetical protein
MYIPAYKEWHTEVDNHDTAWRHGDVSNYHIHFLIY